MTLHEIKEAIGVERIKLYEQMILLEKNSYFPLISVRLCHGRFDEMMAGDRDMCCKYEECYWNLGKEFEISIVRFEYDSENECVVCAVRGHAAYTRPFDISLLKEA